MDDQATNPLVMKRFVPLIALLVTFSAQSQVVSRFIWESQPLTTAVTGPNGSSISSSATSQYVNATIGYAINPGLPTKNVDLILPGSPYFDVNSIDIQLQFRREEGVASFFKRGSYFNFHMNNGALSVTFTTTQGSTPGNITINSGNIMNIPEDHNFHRYRFQYDNNTGIARVWYDGNVVYTYNGVAGRPLAWPAGSNVVVGENMDATSRNVPVLANLTVQNVSSAMLPVRLISFHAASRNNKSLLQWSTGEEINLSHFEVERSADLKYFETVSTVLPSASHRYSVYDDAPFAGSNYYRLKMVDKDGAISYSDIIRLTIEVAVIAKCYPNPASRHVNIILNDKDGGLYDYSIMTISGALIKCSTVHKPAGTQPVTITLDNIAPGAVLIRLQSRHTKATELIRVFKS
jgi:hypothetical protein